MRYFPYGIAVEPSEQQTILFDFIIQRSTKAIKIYSFIVNGKGHDIGWNHTTVHEVMYE